MSKLDEITALLKQLVKHETYERDDRALEQKILDGCVDFVQKTLEGTNL